MSEVITSTANPRVKSLAKLKQRSERDATNRFPIEGSRTVSRAFEAGWPLLELVVAPDLASPTTVELARRIEATGVGVTRLGLDAFKRIAYRKSPDGILAVGESSPLPLDALDIPVEPLLLVVESIEKPGNLGAMLRTADGAGVDAVVVADPSTDLTNPNVVRASQGALFTVPVAVAAAPDVADWLAAESIAAVAALPDAAQPPWAIDLTGATAIIVGSERTGLSTVWMDAESVAIPMRGSGDSLNASIAASVLLYEAVRQRG